MSAYAAVDGLVPGCRLCEAGGPAGEAVYRDRLVVALVDHQLPGVLLAPRSHLDVLEQVPDRAGPLLAAIRRAARTVEEVFDASGARIEPTTDLPGAGGHVCYRVIPTVDDAPIDPSVAAAEPDALAAMLREALAGRSTTLPPG